MLKSNNLNVNVNTSGLIYISFPNISGREVVAAFTTRMGGVSSGRYASMNMGFNNGDDPLKVRENYNILFNELGINPERAVLSHQTHTDNLLIVDERDVGKGIAKEKDYSDIDGLITNCKNIPLVTQFADCVPLLFYDPVQGVIAASHAGWRGTVKKIGEKTVNKMVSTFNCNPKDIKVAIGPSIGNCCYEVDDPVFTEFIKLDIPNIKTVFTPKENGKYMLNLWEANKLILTNCGIKEENICVTDLCTCCHSEYFHSHRATAGNRGNLAAVIALK